MSKLKLKLKKKKKKTQQFTLKTENNDIIKNQNNFFLGGPKGAGGSCPPWTPLAQPLSTSTTITLFSHFVYWMKPGQGLMYHRVKFKKYEPKSAIT